MYYKKRVFITYVFKTRALIKSLIFLLTFTLIKLDNPKGF